MNADGVREGVGTSTYNDGTVYSGEYQNGLLNGVGKTLGSNGEIISWAKYKNGKAEGYA